MKRYSDPMNINMVNAKRMYLHVYLICYSLAVKTSKSWT